MKELSIEEKAKRYDEAVEKLRSLHDDYDTVSTLIDIKEELENIFPELAGSEDEQSKKWILEYLYDGLRKSDEQFKGQFKAVIAWLEKQSTPQVRTGLEWVNTIDDACDKRYAEEYAHGEYCHEQSFKWGFQEGVDWLEKQCEQKPAWSEEDAKHFLRCLGYVEAYIEPRRDDVRWFKSLKDRVQPKQEWNKENENNILFLTSIIEECFKDKEKITLCGDAACANFTKEDVIDRVKSLRPQTTWKPSDEQMDVIEAVINNRSFQRRHLDSLYADLKKLREE